jgi:hypothetical protein
MLVGLTGGLLILRGLVYGASVYFGQQKHSDWLASCAPQMQKHRLRVLPRKTSESASCLLEKVELQQHAIPSMGICVQPMGADP